MAKINFMQRNSDWLLADIKPVIKIGYYPRIAYSLSRSLTGGRGQIKYLGNSFAYDNRYMPLILMHYPNEISNKILSHMTTPPKTVLDIGGNIGQFICTLAHIGDPQMIAHVFEPNTSIFNLLKENTANYKNIESYNHGIGKPGKSSFFYEEGRTAIGGLIKKNAGANKDKLIKKEIVIVNDIAKITGQTTYDLIKIDVEGYEYELLDNMKPLKAKYLFLEVSSIEREKNYDHSELFKLIEKKFGKYDILNLSSLSKGKVIFDVLFKFK